jgi:hypothetical protein
MYVRYRAEAPEATLRTSNGRATYPGEQMTSRVSPIIEAMRKHLTFSPCTLRRIVLQTMQQLAAIVTLCAATLNPAQGAPAPVAETQDPATLTTRSAPPLAADFLRDVAPRLDVPAIERTAYAARLRQALDTAGIDIAIPQFVLLVDRSPQVQAALLYWGANGQGWDFIGATQVSTGVPGRFEHFTTPLGVYAHTLVNPDFRAEGTKNKLGFRGYGSKGMRIYDLGWVKAPRGWGDGAMGVLRLQMHATDPDRGAPRLGTRQSEGCIRIPEKLNDFLDRHGVLDADYERALASGAELWVMRADRIPSASPGRYIVVIDSNHSTRPGWSPLPTLR